MEFSCRLEVLKMAKAVELYAPNDFKEFTDLMISKQDTNGWGPNDWAYIPCPEINDDVVPLGSLDDHQFLVVKNIEGSYAELGEYPVSASIASGKDINYSLSSQGLNVAAGYGPALYIPDEESELGSESYIIDITSLPARKQQVLLSEVERIIEDADESVRRKDSEIGRYDDRYDRDGYGYDTDGYGGMSDIDEYRLEERRIYGHSLDHEDSGKPVILPEEAIQLILQEAYGSGGRTPYEAIREVYDKTMEVTNAIVEEKVQEQLKKKAVTKEKSTKAKGVKKEADKEKPKKTTKAKDSKQAKEKVEAVVEKPVTKKEPAKKEPVAVVKETTKPAANTKATVVNQVEPIKPIYLKPGIASLARNSVTKKNFGFSIPCTHNGKEGRVYIRFNKPVRKDEKGKDVVAWNAKQLFGSKRFKNWVVIEHNTEYRDVGYSITYKDGTRGTVSYDELKQIAVEKNKEFDKKREAKRANTMDMARGAKGE